MFSKSLLSMKIRKKNPETEISASRVAFRPAKNVPPSQYEAHRKIVTLA